MRLQDHYSKIDSAGVKIVDNFEQTEKLLAIGTSTDGSVYLSKEEVRKLKEIVDKFLE